MATGNKTSSKWWRKKRIKSKKTRFKAIKKMCKEEGIEFKPENVITHNIVAGGPRKECPHGKG
jgi:hypothetical protein